MFWDFSSAAGDHVQESASSDPQQLQDTQQQQRASGNCSTLLRTTINPLPKLTSEGTDGEKIYEIVHGSNIRVGAERFHCTELTQVFLHNIMKCDDGIRKELHDSVMLFDGTDALRGSLSA